MRGGGCAPLTGKEAEVVPITEKEMEELLEREIADQEQDKEIDAIWESILQAQGI